MDIGRNRWKLIEIVRNLVKIGENCSKLVKKFLNPPPQKKKIEKKFPFEIPWNGEKIEGEKMGGGVQKSMRGSH